jgi:hypothetical protein
MIAFRQTDPRYPFLWSDSSQPAARWHAAGDGPAHYFADTPDGAWAELLRHEEITSADDAATVRRSLWAIDIGNEPARPARLPKSVLTGGPDTYPACQVYAEEQRVRGVQRLVAPSAALVTDGATGRRIEAGRERPGDPRGGQVVIVFGPPDPFVGWQAVECGAPPPDVLPRVRHVAAGRAASATRGARR